MNSFYMNGYLWKVVFVDPFDPMLVDRTGEYCVATTDPVRCIIFLSKILSSKFLEKVLVHELGHVTMISYNLLEDIHRMTRPKYWIEMEEWMCNFLADYDQEISRIANYILNEKR